MILSEATVAGLQTGSYDTKFLDGQYYVPVNIEVEEQRLLFQFGYNPPLQKMIKTEFEGRKWHGYIDGDNRKIWSAPITQRNLFRLEVLQGKYGSQPYQFFDNDVDRKDEIRAFCDDRGLPAYEHQVEMVQLALNSRWDLWGAEMGTGKTLAAIIAVEMSGYVAEPDTFLWVAPRSALIAAKAEFRQWDTKIYPTFSTYAGLKRLIAEWPEGQPAPKLLVFDEASKLRSPNSQRSEAGKYIADSMREEHLRDCLILELSGTPSPKDPTNWWHLCEVACPGFISEGNMYAFKDRLSIMVKEENIPGVGAFNKLKTWLDSSDKCKHCGETTEHVNHTDDPDVRMTSSSSQDFELHDFAPSVNEVAHLKTRLDGLAGVWLKEDCLDLPEKRYETIILEPSSATLNAAKMIVRTSTRAVDALTRLRTLSDGFFYEEAPTGEFVDCTGCNGSGEVSEYYDKDNPYNIITPEESEGGFRYVYSQPTESEDPITFVPEITGKEVVIYSQRSVQCYICSGEKQIEKLTRKVVEVPCPKLDLTTDLLEQHEEIGRFVIYAGFTGSIDRVVKHCLKQGWTTLKADGHGWITTHPVDGVLPWTPVDAVFNFQNGQEKDPLMVFIGQPGAAGMGLTLHASPTTFYYSNDFQPESRQQSEDRIHRIGMDVKRGGRIIDCIHLPSDEKVIDSLKNSKHLQRMSMKGLQSYYEE